MKINDKHWSCMLWILLISVLSAMSSIASKGRNIKYNRFQQTTWSWWLSTVLGQCCRIYFKRGCGVCGFSFIGRDVAGVLLTLYLHMKTGCFLFFSCGFCGWWLCWQSKLFCLQCLIFFQLNNETNSAVINCIFFWWGPLARLFVSRTD